MADDLAYEMPVTIIWPAHDYRPIFDSVLPSKTIFDSVLPQKGE